MPIFRAPHPLIADRLDSHAFEALGLADIFQDLGQDFLAVVLFPEKALVELLQPGLGPFVCDEGLSTQSGVYPAAFAENVRDRKVIVERKVQGQDEVAGHETGALSRRVRDDG